MTPTSYSLDMPNGRRRRAAGIALAITVFVGLGAAILIPALNRSGHDAPIPPSVSPTIASATPTEPRRPAALDSLADLPTGPPPGLAYVVAGSSVVLRDASYDLEWEVSALSLGSRTALVYDAIHGAIHRVGRGRIELVTLEATSPPVFGGNTAWIENGSEIVQLQTRGRQRQPLPHGCCVAARVAGYDYDMDVDLFVTSREGSWMWDTYEGAEGHEPPPPDSEDCFWPVGRLGTGKVVGTGNGSEVLVKYPHGQWGWGYVTGPRDPATEKPVNYQEQERITATRVWLTTAIVALNKHGRLLVLGEEWRNEHSVHHWRELTTSRTAFALPKGLQVAGVVSENRRSVLIDATDSLSQREWVRCNVRTYQCEIAAHLDADDITPG